MSVKSIPVGELLSGQAAQQPVELIDVRTPAEFRAGHAQGARSVPLNQLEPGTVMRARVGNNASPLYIICQSGTRSRQACEKFVAAGYSGVISVEGGTVAWEKAGGPMVRGKRVMSLERQVRIAAGLLVLLGVALTVAVHPWFVLLAAVIGAGLVFAGVTDTCGMGMVLARMPWNHAEPESAQCDARATGLKRKQA